MRNKNAKKIKKEKKLTMHNSHMIFLISKDQAEKRIDALIADLIEDISRSYVQKLIDDGHITLESSKKISKNYKVKEDDIINVTIPEGQDVKIEKENIPLDIVYEDDYLLVVNKPKGMVVHPAPGNEKGTLVNAVMYHCGEELSTINGEIRSGIVHRIDKDTSGLLMVAKNDIAHRSLAKQLEEHTVGRKYIALVYNNFNEEEGTIDKPIGPDKKIWHKKVVREENSKSAITHYKVLKRYGKYTLIEARLETGRTHQIRVHMSYINHPLVGDQLYGPSKNPLNVKGQMLHAFLIAFTHPSTGERMEFQVEPPDEFKKHLRKLGETDTAYAEKDN